MKWIFILCFTPSFSNAQLCDTLFKEKTDKFDNEKIRETEIIVYENGDNKLGWSLALIPDKKGKTRTVRIAVVAMDERGGCIDESAQVMFLFTDKTKVTRSSGIKFNCEAVGALFFPVKGMGGIDNKEYLKQFSVKKLDAVRIKLMRRDFDYDFTDGQAEEFMQVMKCLISDIQKD